MPSANVPATSGTTVITIDGPAGAGKSTVAKALAGRLGFSYLDTGAMYRALTLKALRRKMDLTDEDALVRLARETEIDLKGNPASGLKVYLDGEDVSAEIRTLEVTNNTYYIARASKVREILVSWQQAIGRKTDIVVEGRDAGTVIFPKATRKFYLDADVDERLQRRLKELVAKGQAVEAEKLRREIIDRDQKDLTRKAGPLLKAEDAVLIDSTRLTVDQVVGKMLEHLRRS
ncbi:MAG: (d)CMP kinase [Candidatus Omnitrophota bacterium]|nr:(d)CMP kinase [Candidatus Omnitrophota bacterium]MDZ4242809.1 (d)CMP kinase [Candidatus Omnitrophota bacterium]